MALILIRAMKKKKALNAIADIERHAGLSIKGKPRIIDVNDIFDVTKRVIKQDPRDDIKFAILVMVQESTTKSIMAIRKTHPPAHIIVVSEEYPEFKVLNDKFYKLKEFEGYYSSKKSKN